MPQDHFAKWILAAVEFRSEPIPVPKQSRLPDGNKDFRDTDKKRQIARESPNYRAQKCARYAPDFARGPTQPPPAIAPFVGQPH